jgi:hypothetical protein
MTGPASPKVVAQVQVQVQVQVLVLDIETGIDDKQAMVALNGRVASALSTRSDLAAITTADIRAMTALGADKAAAGCDASACLSEIANALGARYVVYGRLGKLGESYDLQLNVFDAVSGRSLARQGAQGTSLSSVGDAIPGVVATLADAIAPAGEASTSPWLVAGVATGAVGGIVLVGCGAAALAFESTLQTAGGSVDDKQAAVTWAPALWWTAIGGAAVAAAGTTLAVVGVGP